MFTLSGFADEISADLHQQVSVLNSLSIPAIEVRGVNEKNISQLTLEETEQLRDTLQHAGIRVSAIGSPIGKISLQDPFKPHLDLFRHIIEQARILQAPYVRIFSFYDANALKARSQVLNQLEAFLRHTPSGITLLHENEKGIYGDTAERCLDLLTHFEGAPLLATYDPANFIQVGENAVQAFQTLQPYIAYVHVKDALAADGSVVPVGTGDANWKHLLQMLRSQGYHGYLSLEPHLADFSGFRNLKLEEDLLAAPEKADKTKGEMLFRLTAEKLRNLLQEVEHE